MAPQATQAVARIRKAASDGHPRKLRGLYVDYDGHNVLDPSAITSAEAEQVISDAQLVTEVLRESWLAEGLPERAGEVLDMYGANLAAVFEQAGQAIQADMDNTMAQVQRTFSDARLGTPGLAGTEAGDLS